MDLKDSTLYEEQYRFKERRSNVRFFIVLLLIAAVLFTLRAYWVNNFGGVTVSGWSMYDTLESGDQLVMKYVEGTEAKRGDIVVVDVEAYPDVQKHNQGRPEAMQVKFLIKRLIAIEGDTVKCERGQIYLKKAGEADFSPLEESYAYYSSQTGKDLYNFGPYELTDGDIFFLGDNRCHSTDSRYKEGGSHLKNGLYKAEDIIGIVPEWAVNNRDLLGKIFFKEKTKRA